jgi:hypothetical protein
MIKLTPRRVVFWLVLVPATVAVWAQFLPPCMFGCVRDVQVVTPPPPNEARRFTICGIAGAENCWVVGAPIR